MGHGAATSATASARRRQPGTPSHRLRSRTGVYRVSHPRAHVNRYQLFVERRCNWCAGGRVGLVSAVWDGQRRRRGGASPPPVRPRGRGLPSPASTTATDLSDSSQRALRAADLHEVGRRQRSRADSGCRDSDVTDAPSGTARLTRRLARLSGRTTSACPRSVAKSTCESWNGSGARSAARTDRGWNAHLDASLNASDDRVSSTRDGRARIAAGGRRKQIDHSASRWTAAARASPMRTGPCIARPARLPRRGQRHQPPHADRRHRSRSCAVTTHTLFCLKTQLTSREQHVLCAAQQLRRQLPVRLRVITRHRRLLSRLPAS